MSSVDLSQWPSVEEAAVALRTSARSIIRHNERGELEFRKRQRAGKKPENVVNPDDLEKLKPQPYPVKMPAPQFHPEAFSMTTPALTGEHLDRFLDALRDLGAQRALPAPAAEPARPEPPAVPLHLKLRLTIEEAAAYSGMSERKIRMNVEAGNLDASQDGPRGKWIIKRASLENL